MKKFLSVVKREYIQRVRAKMFIVSTILLPVVMSLFLLVPAIILSIETPPMRVAVVDQTGRMYSQIRQALFNDQQQTVTGNVSAGAQRTTPRRNFSRFNLEEVKATDQSLDQIRASLDQRMRARELEGYVILSPDFLSHGKAQFITRNPGDVFSTQVLQSVINRATREQRLIDAKVDTKTRQELFEPIELQSVKAGATGSQQSNSRASFAVVFGVGFVMYLAILMYGQIVLGAVIEEKETRIAEILFSSVKPFTLMMGKLVGVSLLALTQLAIWGTAFGAFAVYG